MPLQHITADELSQNPELLVHKKSADPHSNEFSNRVGAVLHYGRNFVASPNVDYIPQPPLGATREVYMRADFRYADDDYIHWPQTYYYHYPYLPAIRCEPTNEQSPNSILWWNPEPASPLFQTTSSTIVCLKSSEVLKFENDIISPLKVKLDEYICRPHDKDPENQKEAILFLWNLVANFLSRLKTLPMSEKELRRCIRELQRFALELEAVLYWENVIRRRFSGTLPPAEKVERRLGCFTRDPNLVTNCVKAGIPVWHIQDVNVLIGVRIDKRVDLLLPSASGIVMDEMQPKVPTVFKGPGSDPQRPTNIHIAARVALHSGDVFAWTVAPRRVDPPVAGKDINTLVKHNHGINVNYHPYRAIAVSSDQRKSIKNNLQIVPPLSQHIPTPQPAWLSALQSIDIERFPHALPDDRGYAFPPPYLFYDKVKDRVNTLLLYRWAQLRPMLIYRFTPTAPSILSQPYSAQIWRKALHVEVTPTTSSSNVTKMTKAAGVEREALSIIEGCLRIVGEQRGLYQFLEAKPLWHGAFLRVDNISAMQANEMLWELAEFNFRCELLTLDRRLCALPSPDSLERHEEILDCLVPYPLARAFFVLETPLINGGLCSPTLQERAPFLINMRSLMSNWKTPFSGFKDVTAGSSETVLLCLERAVVSFYVTTFFEMFGRSPSVPHIVVML